MARARNIKPSFFVNEELGELEPLARLAFIGMWTIADFKGCFEFKPKRLKVQLLPYDECDFEQIAINLDKSGFISIYTVQGQRYIKILNFEKHQNPHKNERESGSEIPDISLSNEFSNENNNLENVENNPDKNGTTRADSLNPLTDSLLLNPDSPNLIPDSVPADSGEPTKNGTRLPADWVLPKAWGTWALENSNLSEGQIRIEAEKFKDHWLGTANRASSKRADWQATWRNWIRNAKVDTQAVAKQVKSKMDISGIDYRAGVNDDGSF